MKDKNLVIRPTVLEDEKYLVEWLQDKNTLRWYPMSNQKEIEDACKDWIRYIEMDSVVTAVYKNNVVGSAMIYVTDDERLKHQALFAIIVSKDYRGKGIGTKLIDTLIDMAKNKFEIEILHLEVYETNPAISLYERLGFKKYGEHKNYIKEDGKYFAKILMQKYL